MKMVKSLLLPIKGDIIPYEGATPWPFSPGSGGGGIKPEFIDGKGFG